MQMQSYFLIEYDAKTEFIEQLEFIQATKTLIEEFDHGSDWTLAAGLTHASRAVTGKKLASFADERRTGE